MQIYLLFPLLPLLSLTTVVLASHFPAAVYDNEIEELVEGRDADEITQLIQSLNVDDSVKQIYLKFYQT